MTPSDIIKALTRLRNATTNKSDYAKYDTAIAYLTQISTVRAARQKALEDLVKLAEREHD